MILEVELPFWIDADDVAVEFGERQLALTVRNTLHVRRTYWRNRCGRAARGLLRVCPALAFHAALPHENAWGEG